MTPVPISAPEVRVEPVVASDGARAELILVAPPAPRAALLWIPALGVPAKHYKPFAEALACHGIAVAIHEWRGVGSSDRRASRRVDWGYRDLLEADLPASEAVARAAWPGLPWIIGGHSLGSQFASLHGARRGGDTFAGLLQVASGAPYWRTFPGKRAMLWWLFHVMPLLTAVVGHFPGRRLGFGGNEASSVMRDWARTGRLGRYVVPSVAFDFEAAMAHFARPLLAVRIRDDWLGPQASFDWLLGKFPAAGIERMLLSPEDFANGEATHFSWMKASEPVAAAVDVWLTRDVLG